jgi:hypothetical protein
MTQAREGWWWADADGALRVITLRELRDLLGCFQLPPYVLIWRSEWVDWLPAYLVPELADVAAADLCRPGAPERDPEQTEPPEPPLLWYLECEAGSTVLSPASQRTSLLELDWGEAFSIHECPTVPRAMRVLPPAAFRDLDTYLAHARAHFGGINDLAPAGVK